MAFLNLFLLLQVFYLDDFRYPQSVVITDFNDIFGTSEHQYCTALPFVISLNSLSNSCALTLPLQFLHTLSPHDPIFTKHQACSPSGLMRPMLLRSKFRFVRVEFCFKASARAWQETHDLRNTMKHTAHIVKNCKKRRNLPVVLPIPIRQQGNNEKSMGHQGYTALPICYTLHF